MLEMINANSPMIPFLPHFYYTFVSCISAETTEELTLVPLPARRRAPKAPTKEATPVPDRCFSRRKYPIIISYVNEKFATGLTPSPRVGPCEGVRLR